MCELSLYGVYRGDLQQEPQPESHLPYVSGCPPADPSAPPGPSAGPEYSKHTVHVTYIHSFPKVEQLNVSRVVAYVASEATLHREPVC